MNIDFIEKYKHANNRLILLDYDGTLVDFEPIPSMASPPAISLTAVSIIASHLNTKLYVISGRSQSDIDNYFGELPINIIAEHGAMIKENGKWLNQIDDFGSWKHSVFPIFNHYAVNCPESFIEEKQYAITWHYRKVQPELGYNHSRELIYALNDSAQSYNLRVLDGNKIVEVMKRDINKGNAVKKILEENKFDFVLAIGDDKTDEDMFLELLENNNAFTIKVGDGYTCAKKRIANVPDVINLLEHLALTK